MNTTDELLGPSGHGYVRARRALGQACAEVVEAAGGVKDFDAFGCPELTAAVAALASSQTMGEEEDAANWVARACTLAATDTASPEAQFCAVVTRMRVTLGIHDQAAKGVALHMEHLLAR